MADEWTVFNPPPETASEEDRAQFAWGLFQAAKDERDRLSMEDRWNAAYKLFRGDHDWRGGPQQNKRAWLNINLYFANVQRTIANLTSRNPIAEVIDLDGVGDGADKILSARVGKWWKDASQEELLNDTAQNMEVYGAGIEKGLWSAELNQPDVITVDPFAFFPSPGAREITDCRYICHCSAEPVAYIEDKWNVSGVMADNAYSTLNGERDDSRPVLNSARTTTPRYDVTGVIPVNDGAAAQAPENRALVVEVWLRDYSIEKITEKVPSIDPQTGEEIVIERTTERPKYPGGIRVITVTNSGRVLLSDVANPNINPAVPLDAAQNCFLYKNFPFWMATSYRDTVSLWGFSIAEQVGDLNRRIENIFNRVYDYINRTLAPALILPKGCGIVRAAINNKPNLILEPASAQLSQFIRYMPVPSITPDFYRAIEMLLGFFDRVYQIEDADRGVNPQGVVAASAIVALQERNAVLIRHKIRSIDRLVERRGMAAVSLFLNFGVYPETVEVEGATAQFQGVGLLGRRFNYVVESGSTTPKTSLQVQEQAVGLHKQGAIDNRALLEALNFPGWRKIIERMGETQLDAALNVLIQAGFPQEAAIQLRQVLMQPQGGPGDTQQGNGSVAANPVAGTPKSMQGREG